MSTISQWRAGRVVQPPTAGIWVSMRVGVGGEREIGMRRVGRWVGDWHERGSGEGERNWHDGKGRGEEDWHAGGRGE